MTVYKDRFGRAVTDSGWIGDTYSHPVKATPSVIAHMRYVFSKKKNRQDAATPDREVKLIPTCSITWIGLNVKEAAYR